MRRWFCDSTLSKIMVSLGRTAEGGRPHVIAKNAASLRMTHKGTEDDSWADTEESTETGIRPSESRSFLPRVRNFHSHGLHNRILTFSTAAGATRNGCTMRTGLRVAEESTDLVGSFG